MAARVTVQREITSLRHRKLNRRKAILKNLVLNPETLNWSPANRRFAWAKEFQIFETCWRIQRKFLPKKNCSEAVWEEVTAWRQYHAQFEYNLRKKIAQLDPTRITLKPSGAWVFAERRQVMGLVLILVVLVLLQTGLPSPSLCSRICRNRFKSSSKMEGCGLTSRVSQKRIGHRLTKQVSDLFDQIERPIGLPFKRKDLDMAIKNIAHDIRTPLTIASAIPNKSSWVGRRKRS